MKILKKIVLWFFGLILGLIILMSALLYFFQDKLIAAAVQEINKYLSVKAEIDPDIELTWWQTFPNVSVRFKNVRIYESVSASDSLMGKAQEVFLAFHTWQLLRGEYEIQQLQINQGDFNLRVTSSGIRNYLILKDDTTSSGGASAFQITSITGTNNKVTYRDQRDGQVYSFFLESLDAALSIDTNKYVIQLDSKNKVLEMAVAGTSFLSGKSSRTKGQMVYEPGPEIFTFQPSEIELEEAVFNVKGYVNLKKSQLDLRIENKHSDVKALISLLPEKLYTKFKSYKSSGEIYLKSSFTGNYGPNQNPFIQVDFGFKKVSLQEPQLGIQLTDIDLEGTYSNGEQQNVRTSVLELKNIVARLEKETIKGSLLIRNFSDPFVKWQCAGNLHVPWLVKLINSEQLKSGRGTIRTDFSFEGNLSALRSKSLESFKASGELEFDSVTMAFASLPYSFSNASGVLLFNNTDVAVENFTFQLGKSDLVCNGFIKNLLPRFVNGEKRMLADLQIESKSLDIAELLGPESAQSTANEKPASGTFPYLEEYVLKIQLLAQTVSYKKVVLRKLQGIVRFDQPYLEISNATFGLAGGEVQGNASMVFHSSSQIQTSLKTKLDHLHIDSLFYMFDDFGQNFIGQKNLKGKFSGTVDALLYFDKNGNIDTEKLVANIDGSIRDGELNDFEPMQNLSKFIKAEELAHIRFSELSNKIFISKRTITLPEMRILSNVSNISIAGTHTFDNLMDYQLAIPLKNLRQSTLHKEESEGAVEEDQKMGTTVFLTIKGTPDNYKIAYDTKRVGKKIKEDLKKEKEEFKSVFKKQNEEMKEVKPDKNEFFEWE
ncbi:MAG: AsmA family protein [Cytophagaceae bacterium]|nr:AsmA family protein [Cytophagaceae bacterium]